MKLEMARHPCLEVQDDVAFIANDITLERGIGTLLSHAFTPVLTLLVLRMISMKFLIVMSMLYKTEWS